MDFALSEEQEAIADLAGRIFTEKLPPERLREIEPIPRRAGSPTTCGTSSPSRTCSACAFPNRWAGAATASSKRVCWPSSRGAPSRRCRSFRRWCSARCRSRGSVRRTSATLLAGVIDGSVILTAALTETGDYLTPSLPVDARPPRTRGGWRLTGTKVVVPAAHLATSHPRAGAGRRRRRRLPRRPRRGRRRDRTQSSRINDEPLSTVHLDGAAGEPLGDVDDGAAIIDWISDRAVAALCATQAGVCEAALRLTAALRVRARAVRLQDRDVPGGRAAHRRRLHRCRSDPPHRTAGGMAARRGAARGGRAAHRQVLGRRRRPSRRARGAAPARRASASISTTRCTATSAGRR